MSYAPILMIGLLMLMAVAGSSRFVQLVSVKDHAWNPAPRPSSRPHRFAHAALLLLVIFWPASPSQAPVRDAAPAAEVSDDATGVAPRPCMYVKGTAALVLVPSIQSLDRKSS